MEKILKRMSSLKKVEIISHHVQNIYYIVLRGHFCKIDIMDLKNINNFTQNDIKGLTF